MTFKPLKPDPRALLKQLQLVQQANRYAYLNKEVQAKLIANTPSK